MKFFKKLTAVLLTLAMLISLMPTSFAAQEVPEHWKFMKLYAVDQQTDISISYYRDNKTLLYYVYNPAAIQAVLRFTLVYGQPVALAVYESSNEINLDMLWAHNGGALVGPNVNGVGPQLGARLGYLMDVKGNTFDTTTPYQASGYRCPLPEDFPDDPGPVVDENPDLTPNLVYWNGMVNNAGTTFRLGEGADEGHLYVLAIEPIDGRTSQYKSYLGIGTNYDFAEDLMGYNEYVDKYGNLGLDPVDLTTGNFVWHYTDLEAFGSDSLSWIRTYNSLDTYNGALGSNWRHGFLFYIEERPLSAEVYFPDGAKLTFQAKYNGEYTAPKGTEYRLVKDGGGFTLSGLDKTQYRFDSDGKILSYTDVHGKITSYTYSGSHLTKVTNDNGHLAFTYNGDHIVSVTDGTSKTVTYEYDGNGDLVKMTNSDGDSLDYVYDGNHNLKSISDFNGNAYITNTYDDKHRVITQALMGQGTATIRYDPANRKSICTDANGLVTTYFYNESQQITEIRDSESGNANTFDDRGRLSSVTDRMGQVTSYTYDDAGNLTKVVSPDNTTETSEYNALNLITKSTARDGGITQYGYDGLGNLTSVTDPLGHVTSYTYDLDNNLTSMTDAENATTSYTYDAKGNCLTETDAEGGVTRHDYDDQGRLIRTTQPLGEVTEYEYTTAGKLVKTIQKGATPDKDVVTAYDVNGNGYTTGTTDPMEFTTTTEYNPMNHPVKVTDAEGNSTTYRYDEMGRLTMTTTAEGGETTYGYDQKGRLTSMTDARGSTWTYEYDAEGRMVSTKDPLGNETKTEYDEMGRTKTSANARGYETNYEYDAMGRGTKGIDALDNFTETVYDLNGQVTESKDKRGSTTSYKYDKTGRLVETTDALGHVTKYTYDKLGRTTATTDAENGVSRSEYNANGQLTASVDPMNGRTEYTYDYFGRLIETRDALGHTTKSEYDKNGRLTKATDELGHVTSYTYNKNGQVLTVTDALGGVTTNTYDKEGRTLTVTDALHGVTGYAYDKAGSVSAMTDALGGVTRYTYDKLGRTDTVTDPRGGVSKNTYDENGNVKTITNADGGVTSYIYDALDRVSQTTDPEGNITKYTYDANGNQLTVTDGRGGVTHNTYDKLNRVIETKNAENSVRTTTYDALGRVKTSTNEEGAVTTYFYDKNGRTIEVKDALNHSQTFTYDALGRVKTATDEKGAVTQYEYDACGQLLKEIDKKGYPTTYAYDALGRQLSVTRLLDETTRYKYDKLGRVLKTTDPLGAETHFTYDKLSRVKTVTAQKSSRHAPETTEYFYDANGNVTSVRDALGGVSRFEYDAMNRLVKVDLNRKDAATDEHQITLYEYNKNGLVTKTINAENSSKLCVYDENGNLTQTTDEDGNITAFAYTPTNLVKSINYTGGKAVAFAYNKAGQLVEMQDWNGTTTFALDVLGRIQAVNDHNSRDVSYTYTPTGQVESMTYPGGSVVAYGYDDMDRLVSVTDGANRKTSYAYDELGRVKKQTYSDGEFVEYSYDKKGQLLGQKDGLKDGTTRRSYKFEYDDMGNLIAESRDYIGVHPQHTDLAYDYDALNRLTGSTMKGHAETKTTEYQYDSLGNLILEKANTDVVKYTYNKLNQLTTKGSETYTYDKRGNLVSQTESGKTRSYTYDGTNRMVKGTNAKGETSEYVYNGLGYRVGHITTAANENYSHRDNDNAPGSPFMGHYSDIFKNPYKPTVPQVTWADGVGLVREEEPKTEASHFVLDYTSYRKNEIAVYEEGRNIAEYVFGLDRISGELKDYAPADPMAPQTRNIAVGIAVQDVQFALYHQDRLGSTSYLTKEDGSLFAFSNYDPWGVPQEMSDLTNTLGVTTTQVPHDLNKGGLGWTTAYTGHPYDEVLGVYWAQARMYDAVDRRFVAVDVVRQGTNVYAYVLDNPVRYWDPTGHLAIGDEKRPIAVQMELIALTNAWYAASTQKEKDKIHQKAVVVRKGTVQPQDYSYTKTDSRATADAQVLTNAFAAQYTANGNRAVSATQYWNLIYDCDNNPRSSIGVYTNTVSPSSTNNYSVQTNTMTTFGARTVVMVNSSYSYTKSTAAASVGVDFKLKNEREACFIGSMAQLEFPAQKALIVLDYLNEHYSQSLDYVFTGKELRELYPNQKFSASDNAISAIIDFSYYAAMFNMTLVDVENQMMLQRLNQLETLLFIQSLNVIGNPLLYASESGPISSVPEPEFRQFNFNVERFRNLDNVLNNPTILSEMSPSQVYGSLRSLGYNVVPLNDGSLKGIPFEQGGGFKVNWGGDRLLQYHPGGGVHSGSYWKVSSGTTGTTKIPISGTYVP